jgi:phenylalanyl-tRNA synthetase beta subunit
MTYSFGDVGVVEIKKGLATDKEKLRSSLSGGVERAFQMNMLNAPLLGIDMVRMYEFGNVFTKSDERRQLALIIDDGKKKTSFTEEVDLILSEIKRELGVATLDYETVTAKPYCIVLDFDTLISQLPDPTLYEPLSQDTHAVTYQAVSPYPFIARDIAMWVPADTTWESIHNLVAEVRNPLVIRTDLFDTFTKTIDGKELTSYAFRLVFQSFEKTLTDEEVNTMMQEYYDIFKNKGYEIR